MKFNLQPKKTYKKLRKERSGFKNPCQFLALIMLFMVGVYSRKAQNINMNFKNAKLETVLKEVERQSNQEVFYAQNVFKDSKLATISVKNSSLQQTLNQMFKNQALRSTVANLTIVVSSKTEDLGNDLDGIPAKASYNMVFSGNAII